MKTTPVTPADLARSVIAVPPLARNADHSLDTGANNTLITHMEQGGIRDPRDGISPIRVLHDAVSLSGIADMGPMLPLLTDLPESQRRELAPIARRLLVLDQALRSTPT